MGEADRRCRRKRRDNGARNKVGFLSGPARNQIGLSAFCMHESESELLAALHEISSEFFWKAARNHVGIFCKAFVDPAGRREVTLHEIKSAFFGLHDIESEFFK